MLVRGTVYRAGQDPLRDAEVLVEGDRISAIRRGPSSDRWVVPGLVDAHVHFFQSGGLHTRPDIIDLTARVPYDEERRRIRERLPDTFRRYLACGVTGVVDCGGPFWNFEVRDLARRTEAAPHVAVTGPLVSTYGPKALQTDDPPIIQCDTPAAARELVKRQLDLKPDFVKIWFVLLERTPASLLPVVEATIDEAHRADLRVAVHATELETARAAVAAGGDILVHSVFDREVDDAFLVLLRRKRVIYVPTLMVVDRYRETLSHTLRLTPAEVRLGNPWVISTLFEPFPDRKRPPTPAGATNLRRVHEAGVTIAAGTDAGNVGTPHGPAIFRELEMMVEAGLAPAAALESATLGGAKVLGQEREAGSIEVGKRADLVVLSADPTADVRNLTKIERVVKGGRAWTQGELLPRGPEDVVQHQLAAYNARNVDAFVETYADDAEIVRGGEVVLRGRAALRERYAKLFRENPRNHAAITRRDVAGNVVTDDEHVTGRADGKDVFARARYEVEGGVIRRVTFLPLAPG